MLFDELNPTQPKGDQASRHQYTIIAQNNDNIGKEK